MSSKAPKKLSVRRLGERLTESDIATCLKCGIGLNSKTRRLYSLYRIDKMRYALCRVCEKKIQGDKELGEYLLHYYVLDRLRPSDFAYIH